MRYPPNWTYYKAVKRGRSIMMKNFRLFIVSIFLFIAGAFTGHFLTESVHNNYKKVALISMGISLNQSLEKKEYDEALLLAISLIAQDLESYSGYVYLGDIFVIKQSPLLADWAYKTSIQRVLKADFPENRKSFLQHQILLKIEKINSYKAY